MGDTVAVRVPGREYRRTRREAVGRGVSGRVFREVLDPPPEFLRWLETCGFVPREPTKMREHGMVRTESRGVEYVKDSLVRARLQDVVEQRGLST